MKQITFSYLNKEFTLDLEKGELFGDDEIIKQQIIQGINRCNNEVLGGHNTRFKCTNITEPYKNITQFAMAFYYGVTKMIDYPNELNEYLPYFKPVEVDYTGLTEEDAEIVRQIHRTTYY